MPALRHCLAGTPRGPETEQQDEEAQDVADAGIGFEKQALHILNPLARSVVAAFEIGRPNGRIGEQFLAGFRSW